MNMTIGSIAIRSSEKAYATAPKQFAPVQDIRPDTIVLQPQGTLDESSSPTFQAELEEAIEHATEAVIIDFLWVESTDLNGVAALVAGIQRAADLGKLLSFQSMDSRTRAALAAEGERQRKLRYGSWSSLFKQDLEQFLDSQI